MVQTPKGVQGPPCRGLGCPQVFFFSSGRRRRPEEKRERRRADALLHLPRRMRYLVPCLKVKDHQAARRRRRRNWGHPKPRQGGPCTPFMTYLSGIGRLRRTVQQREKSRCSQQKNQG